MSYAASSLYMPLAEALEHITRCFGGDGDAARADFISAARNGALQAFGTLRGRHRDDIPLWAWNGALTADDLIFSRQFDILLWCGVEVYRSQINTIWPAPIPATVKSLRAQRLIFDHLKAWINQSDPPTKDQARDECEKLDGFYQKAFDDAWKQLPSNYKRGAGKHGGRRLKG